MVLVKLVALPSLHIYSEYFFLSENQSSCTQKSYFFFSIIDLLSW